MREDELIIYEQSRGICRRDYDSFYTKSRCDTDWANPTTYLSSKFYFLNQFGCRLSNNIENRLVQVLEEVSPLFDRLRAIELQDLGENQEACQVVVQIFDGLNRRATGFAEVATSKFLHMTFPHLMAMVDSAIFGHLSLSGIIEHFWNGEHYLKILNYYSNEINGLISDIEQKHAVSRLEAIAGIRAKDASALGSIPRIIDKHFFWIAHQLESPKFGILPRGPSTCIFR